MHEVEDDILAEEEASFTMKSSPKNELTIDVIIYVIYLYFSLFWFML